MIYESYLSSLWNQIRKQPESIRFVVFIIGGFWLQVGMAALLASVCSVPLTSVLLLFELTKDYHILLPLMVKKFIIVV